MNKIAIVTDSTANLPESFIQKHDIKVAHLVVIWGEKTLRDGIEITADTFYPQLKNSDVMPTTSQPTVTEFIEIFKPLVIQDIPIVCVLISDKLSGTIQSAEQAKRTFPGARISIVDSEMADSPEGLQVMRVARAVAAGMSYEEVVEIANEGKHRSGAIFAVDTLEYLHRGGRIGGAAKFFGTALNIKPLLMMKDGRIEALKQVRTKKLAHSQLLEVLEERLNGAKGVHVAIMHSAAQEDAEQMLDKVLTRCAPEEAYIQQINPVIGTHTGPGTVGIAYYIDVQP